MMLSINLIKLTIFTIFTNILVIASELTPDLPPSTLSHSTRCPSVTFEYHQNQCYQFVPVEMYWTDAVLFCQQEGGRLLKISDESCNRYIIDSLNSMSWWTKNGVWIGLNDLRKNGQWMWSNKNTTEEFHSDQTGYSSLYTNHWGSGHPNGWFSGFRNCVRMVRGSGQWLWHETACYSYPWKYGFICQFDALLPPTLPPTILPPFALLSQSKHHNDLNFENLRIDANSSHDELKTDETITESFNNTGIILLFILLSISFVILTLFFFFKFWQLKTEQLLKMETLNKSMGCKHGGVCGLSKMAVSKKRILKIDDVGDDYVGGVGFKGVVGHGGCVGGNKRCWNEYVEEGTQRKNMKGRGGRRGGRRGDEENIYEFVS